MISRRDILIVLISISATYGVTTLATPDTAVMGSRVFDWHSFTAKQTSVGWTRQVCQEPTATLDELECHITTLNPGASPHAPHKHPDEELIIIREGTVEAMVNGEMKRVGPGSVIFQAANQLHSIRNVGDTPATYHVVKWNSPGMLKARKQEKN